MHFDNGNLHKKLLSCKLGSTSVVMLMTEDKSDNDWIGFVFSYQDSSNFYVVLSARHDITRKQGPWRIVRVNSNTGPSLYLGDLTYGGLIF